MSHRSSATLAASLLTLSAIAGCSMPGEPENPNDPSPSVSTATPGAKQVSINGREVAVPKGYTLTSDYVDGTTKTVILTNSRKMPTNINVARNPAGFNVNTWCDDMGKMLKQNFAKGASIETKKIPSSGSATECRIIGHGKTANTNTSSSSSSTSSSTTSAPSTSKATTSSTSSATSSSTTSDSPKVIAPGTPYSIMTYVKRAPNGAYIALMSRELNESYAFTEEKKFFDTITK